jgi:Fic-DOC domain mobile mystery protein B
MSQAVLAGRMGVSAAAVNKLEHAEVRGGITTAKLAEVGAALDCVLVYALVPRATLEGTFLTHARAATGDALGNAGRTVKLEAQTLEAQDVQVGGPPDGAPPLTFDVRTIGREPAAAPLGGEDLLGLIPGFVATRADLEQVEFENINRALPWAELQARSLGPEGILEYGFLFTLHGRMFGDVWTWAGAQRSRATKVGVEPALIRTYCRLLFNDAKFWHDERVFGPDDLAARIHCRLLGIRPFRVGNGRCSRLMADLYLISTGREPFVWGGPAIDVDGSLRARYNEALTRAAESDDYVDLVRFARGHA